MKKITKLNVGDGWRKMYAKDLEVIEPFLIAALNSRGPYRLYFEDGTQIIATYFGSSDSDNGLALEDPDYEEVYDVDFIVKRVEKRGPNITYYEDDLICLDYKTFFYKFELIEEEN